MLSVIRFTDSAYPFGIFKLCLPQYYNKNKICRIQLSAPDAPQNVTGDVVISPANDNSSSCLVNVSWSPPLYTDSNNEVSSYVIKWYKVIPIHLSKFIEPHQMLEDVSGVCI